MPKPRRVWFTVQQLTPSDPCSIGSFVKDAESTLAEIDTDLKQKISRWNDLAVQSFFKETIEDIDIGLAHANRKLNELVDLKKTVNSTKIEANERALLQFRERLNGLKMAYRESLIERNFALLNNLNNVDVEALKKEQQLVSFCLMPPSVAYENPKLVEESALKSFATALVVLKNPELAEKLSLIELYQLLRAHYKRGVTTKTSKEFCTLVFVNIAGRIQTNKIDVVNVTVAWLLEFDHLKNEFLGFAALLNDAEAIQLRTFLRAFNKIYYALYDGQSSLFKVDDDVSVDVTSLDTASAIVVLRQSIARINSLKSGCKRIEEAWRLAQMHYANCNEKNNVLIKSIYSYAFQQSGPLARSRLLGVTLYRSNFSNETLEKLGDEQMQAAAKKEGTRTWMIAQQLSRP